MVWDFKKPIFEKIKNKINISEISKNWLGRGRESNYLFYFANLKSISIPNSTPVRYQFNPTGGTRTGFVTLTSLFLLVT